MKKNAIRIIFILSIILNAATITMIVRIQYIFTNTEHLDFRVDFAGARLGLNPDQLEQLRVVSHQYEERLGENSAERNRVFTELMALSLSTENDLSRAPEAVEALETFHTDMSELRQKFIVDVLKILTPEQRTQVFAMRKKPPAYMRSAPLGPLFFLLPPEPLDGLILPPL